jgi:hypothetical protein
MHVTSDFSLSASPVVTGLEYNHTLLTLTCTSDGGPVDSVTWRRDGVEVGPQFNQTQTLTDTVSATYQHTLSSDVAEFVGSFTCEVRDAAGNTDSRTLNVNGECNCSIWLFNWHTKNLL